MYGAALVPTAAAHTTPAAAVLNTKRDAQTCAATTTDAVDRPFKVCPRRARVGARRLVSNNNIIILAAVTRSRSNYSIVVWTRAMPTAFVCTHTGARSSSQPDAGRG